MKYEPVEYGYITTNDDDECDWDFHYEADDALGYVLECVVSDMDDSDKYYAIDMQYGPFEIGNHEFTASEILENWGGDIDEIVLENLWDIYRESRIPIGNPLDCEDGWKIVCIPRVRGTLFPDVTKKDWDHISNLRPQDSYTLKDLEDKPWFFVRRNGRIMAVKA